MNHEDLKGYKLPRTTVSPTTWQQRHNAALRQPRGVEASLLLLIRGLESYKVTMQPEKDAFLTEHFTDACTSVHQLLNSFTGRLDTGLLSRRICEVNPEQP